MPGAHSQFQCWFLCFVPLLLTMTGLPPLMTAWIPIVIYPVHITNEVWILNVQHIMLLVIGLWLMTVGPYNPYKNVARVIKDE